MPHVLIIEDSYLFGEFVADAATLAGAGSIEVAESQAAAERAAARRAPDLIIADAWGESTTTLDPAERQSIVDLARQCPLIMATGREWAARVDPAELGLVGLLLKPFELEDLLVVMRSLET